MHGTGPSEGLSVAIQRNGGVQPTSLYLHVLLKRHVIKKIVFLAAIFMNSSVAWYIIPLIKSRRIRWAMHVARMGGEERCI